MNKLKKTLKITLITVLALVVLLIASVSPLTKYVIERFDKQVTGREITMDWAYVNPFTGYLHFSNLTVYEFERDSIFLAVDGLSANISMLGLFSKNYEINELRWDKPRGMVSQKRKVFNFDDLIDRFFRKKDSTGKKDPLHLSILNIRITDGEFYYREVVTPINYFIKKVNIESPGFRWDVDTIPVRFSFLSGMGSGDMKGVFSINLKEKDYTLSVLVHKFDLNIVGQYIKDLSNYGNFKALLDADFKSAGNLLDQEDVTNSGLISVSDFHFGKDSLEDFAAFKNLTFAIKEVSPKKLKYIFDSISLKQPYFKYEKYDYLDNVQTMFGKKGANLKAANEDGARFNLVIEIVKHIKTLSKNLVRSNYKLDRLAIYNGQIRYNDYSLTEKFAVELNPFTFMADSVDKTHKRVNFKLGSGIRPYGDIALNVSLNPLDSSDFDLKYRFQKLPASLFNPYLLRYTSFPLDRGTIELAGIWHVRNGQINSDNHVVVIDPRIGERSGNKNTKWLPLRLAMFFVRERGNVIDYEVPIRGNLKDPKFKLRDVLVDALENIFVKPVTTPYRLQVKNTETEIEKSLSLKWEMRSATLTSKQEKFLKRVADFLNENEQAVVIITPQRYELKEKEYILFYEAKKKYFIERSGKNVRSFDKEDSLKVEKMSAKDSLFVKYLNEKTRDPLLFTAQAKCLKLVGAQVVDSKFEMLNSERWNVFMSYFEKRGSAKQVKVAAGKNVIPYNGFSFYKIEYKGEFPEYLLKAYQKMSQLNNEAPRDKFKNDRQKIDR